MRGDGRLRDDLSTVVLAENGVSKIAMASMASDRREARC